MAINIDGESSPAGNPVQSGCEIKPPRNSIKALVTKGMRSGCTVVVKDCSHCSAWASGPMDARVCAGRPAPMPVG
jgi:hypothetical protein